MNALLGSLASLECMLHSGVAYLRLVGLPSRQDSAVFGARTQLMSRPHRSMNGHLVDWHRVLFGDGGALWLTIEARARQRFPDAELARQATHFLLERLPADDWRVLCGFRGEARPGSYLLTVAERLITDFARARFGRPRPPKWLSELGGIWLRVWELVCLQRTSPVAAAGILEAEGCDPLSTLNIAICVRGRVADCGRDQADPGEAQGGDDAHAMVEALPGRAHDAPDQRLEGARCAALLDLLGLMLRNRPDASGSDIGGGLYTPPKVLEALNGLSWDDDARLLMTLVYVQGMTLSAAARVMGLSDSRTRRQHNELLDQLRSALESAGVDTDVLGLLGDSM